MLQGQAKVQKQDSENGVIETGVIKYPKGDKQTNISDADIKKFVDEAAKRLRIRVL